jgi:hypothetical protein
MHVDTGEIRADFLKEEDAREKGFVPITKREAGRLLKMPPAQRPAALLEIRTFHPLARLPGLTTDDVRKLRNAAKRERRARHGK